MRIPRAREVMLGLGLIAGTVGVARDSHVDNEIHSNGPDAGNKSASDYLMGGSTEYGKIDHNFFDRNLVLHDIEKRIIGDTSILTPEERMEREKRAKKINDQWCYVVGKFANKLERNFAHTAEQFRKSFASLTMDDANKEKVRELIEKYATIAGIPPELLIEMLIVESQGNSFATSTAKPSAKGIMQLLPLAAKAGGLRVTGEIDERYNNEQSIRASAGQLERDIGRCYGAKDLGILMYNMGEGSFKDMICRMYPIVEKKRYVIRTDSDGTKHHRYTFTNIGELQFKKMVEDGTINVVEIINKNIEDQKNNEHKKNRRTYDTSYPFKVIAATDLAKRLFKR